MGPTSKGSGREERGREGRAKRGEAERAGGGEGEGGTCSKVLRGDRRPWVSGSFKIC